MTSPHCRHERSAPVYHGIHCHEHISPQHTHCRAPFHSHCLKRQRITRHEPLTEGSNADDYHLQHQENQNIGSHTTVIGAKGKDQACRSDPECSEPTKLLAERHIQAILYVYAVFSVRGASVVVVLIVKDRLCAISFSPKPHSRHFLSRPNVFFLSAKPCLRLDTPTEYS